MLFQFNCQCNVSIVNTKNNIQMSVVQLLLHSVTMTTYFVKTLVVISLSKQGKGNANVASLKKKFKAAKQHS